MCYSNYFFTFGDWGLRILYRRRGSWSSSWINNVLGTWYLSCYDYQYCVVGFYVFFNLYRAGNRFIVPCPTGLLAGALARAQKRWMFYATASIITTYDAGYDNNRCVSEEGRRDWLLHAAFQSMPAVHALHWVFSTFTGVLCDGKSKTRVRPETAVKRHTVFPHRLTVFRGNLPQTISSRSDQSCGTPTHINNSPQSTVFCTLVSLIHLGAEVGSLPVRPSN